MKYRILDYHYGNGDELKSFNTKKEVMDWVVDGLKATWGCGCEMEPYVRVLLDLETTNRHNLRFA